MKAQVLSPRHRAVGFAIVVSIIMLGAAALASAGVMVAPELSSGSTNTSSAVALSPTSSAVSTVGQGYTVSLNGSSAVVVSSPSPTPSPASPSSSGLMPALTP
ncbi:MAG: hypothetical protein ACLP8V_01985, partial [Thermoplasmata archaeon]